MRKDIVAQEERGERILLVVDKYPGDFAGAVPSAAVSEIRAGVGELAQLPVSQKTGADASSGATAERRALIKGMESELRALRRTFDQAKRRDQNISGDLNLPADRKDATIVAAARAAIALLTPLLPKFVARGKSPDFLDELNADIAHFDALTAQQQGGQLQSQSSTQDLEMTVHDLIDAYEDLNDFVENKWANEPKKLGEWHIAEKLGTIRRNPGDANPTPTAPA